MKSIIEKVTILMFSKNVSVSNDHSLFDFQESQLSIRPSKSHQRRIHTHRCKRSEKFWQTKIKEFCKFSQKLL